jgi:hypothetical protein
MKIVKSSLAPSMQNTGWFLYSMKAPTADRVSCALVMEANSQDVGTSGRRKDASGSD